MHLWIEVICCQSHSKAFSINSLSIFIVVCCCCLNKVLLCGPGWPWTCDLLYRSTRIIAVQHSGIPYVPSESNASSQICLLFKTFIIFCCCYFSSPSSFYCLRQSLPTWSLLTRYSLRRSNWSWAHICLPLCLKCWDKRYVPPWATETIFNDQSNWSVFFQSYWKLGVVNLLTYRNIYYSCCSHFFLNIYHILRVGSPGTFVPLGSVPQSGSGWASISSLKKMTSHRHSVSSLWEGIQLGMGDLDWVSPLWAINAAVPLGKVPSALRYTFP